LKTCGKIIHVLNREQSTKVLRKYYWRNDQIQKTKATFKFRRPWNVFNLSDNFF